MRYFRNPENIVYADKDLKEVFKCDKCGEYYDFNDIIKILNPHFTYCKKCHYEINKPKQKVTIERWLVKSGSHTDKLKIVEGTNEYLTKNIKTENLVKMLNSYEVEI